MCFDLDKKWDTNTAQTIREKKENQDNVSFIFFSVLIIICAYSKSDSNVEHYKMSYDVMW